MLIGPIRLSRGRVMILTRTQTQTWCDRERLQTGHEGSCCCCSGYRLAMGTVTNQSEHPHISPGRSNQQRMLSLTWYYQTQPGGRVSSDAKPVWNVDLRTQTGTKTELHQWFINPFKSLVKFTYLKIVKPPINIFVALFPPTPRKSIWPKNYRLKAPLSSPTV